MQWMYLCTIQAHQLPVRQHVRLVFFFVHEQLVMTLILLFNMEVDVMHMYDKIISRDIFIIL